MKIFVICIIALSIATIGESQVCASLDNWSFVSDNGDGTCTYNISIIVDSGNGASGTATFFNDGSLVHTETSCTCNPTTVSFQVTVACESTISIEVEYDAPGNGNDCSGTTVDIVLPIEWGNISIRNEGVKNNLLWSTLMEVNNEKFVIEHSKSSIDFNEIGIIKGAGVSSSKMEYSFSHVTPSSGINYYRIKQVDYDGHYVYSKILSTTNKLKKGIQTYPNPFNEIIYITTEDDTEQWEIIDIYGNTILKGSSKEISTSNLIEGTYIIRLFNGSNFQQEVIMKM